MNPIRKALKELLEGDEQLDKLSSGVFYQIAPAGTKLPYVLFDYVPGTPPLYGFNDTKPLERGRWTVKGVGKAGQAEEIHKRCKELLDGASLELEGMVHKDLRRVGDINYVEEKDGNRYNHVGADYKIDTEDE